MITTPTKYNVAKYLFDSGINKSNGVPLYTFCTETRRHPNNPNRTHIYYKLEFRQKYQFENLINEARKAKYYYKQTDEFLEVYVPFSTIYTRELMGNTHIEIVDSHHNIQDRIAFLIKVRQYVERKITLDSTITHIIVDRYQQSAKVDIVRNNKVVTHELMEDIENEM